jgi:hypothetical protein
VAAVTKTLATLLVTLVAAAADAGLRDVEACIEANLPRKSTVQKLTLAVEDGGETIFESRLTLYWRRLDDGERRIVLRFREPEELAGASLLVHRKPRSRPKVYIYLPDQGDPRVISSRGELEGFLGRANLGIAELQLLLEPLSDKKATLLEERVRPGERSVWIVEERKEVGEDDDGYPRAVISIDQEYCIPLRAELYGSDGLAAKVLEVDAAEVERVEETWMPTRLVFRDLVRGTDTILRVEDAEIDKPLAPSLLTVESLPKLSR